MQVATEPGSKPTAVPGHPYGDPDGWCRDVADPYLNHHGPPTRIQSPYGRDGWIVTRLDDVRLVLGDRRFSNALAAKLDIPRTAPVTLSRLAMILGVDPPEHTYLRRVFNDGYSAARVRRWQPWVKQQAHSRIARLVAAGQSADLARDLFDPLSLDLSGEVLGIPSTDRSRLAGWGGAHHSSSLPPAEFNRRVSAAGDYMDDLVRHRRQHPGDDLISEVVQARDHRGDPTTDSDIASLALGLFTTGAGLLTAQLQISTHALLSHPQELAKLRSHPELMPRAVDELLRYTPIIIGPMRARCVVEDVEVGGVQLRAGELVLPAIAAAGFDPSVIADPYRLDLSRRRVPALTFGFGAHFCQGIHLARMVMNTVLTSLLEGLPDLRVAVPDEQLRWQKGRRIRSFEELPVSW